MIPGRCYYVKSGGLHWEVWYCNSDESADPVSGAKEWKACSTKFWRWVTAARIANEMWKTFNDGVYVQQLREIGHYYDANWDWDAPYEAAVEAQQEKRNRSHLTLVQS